MYLPFQDATLIPVRFDAGVYSHGDVKLPRVDAVAVRDKAGKLWLALTNLDPNRPVRVDVSFAGLQVRSARGEVLTAPRVDSNNSFDAPTNVVPKPLVGKAVKGSAQIELPGKSVAVLQIEG
jgi:alpha-N-arabinofuranosidase